MRIEDIDKELQSAGVPLRHRPLDCFKQLHGYMPEGPERYMLFDQISDWFIKKYGVSVRWDGVIARFPILIQGAIYLARVCFVNSGESLKRFEEDIEDLREIVARSLSREETRSIVEKLIFANRNLGNLYNLLIEDDCLATREQSLVKRAFYDLENAAVTLKFTGDTQTAVVQSHEAAEKFLKAALSKVGSTKDPKSFHHDVPKIYDELLQFDQAYSCLSLPVANLQRLSPNMELRYSIVPRSLKMASEAYHGALYLCGMMAQMWLFDRQRGNAKSSFKQSAFYLDGGHSTFFCKSVEGNSVVLTFFRSSPHTGTQMADITLDANLSALYIEVTDPDKHKQLRLQFQALLRNRGRQVSPEEFGIKSTHGPEGSFTTGVFKARIVK